MKKQKIIRQKESKFRTIVVPRLSLALVCGFFYGLARALVYELPDKFFEVFYSEFFYGFFLVLIVLIIRDAIK